ncbi:MAG: hypothetical protein LUF00_01345 [Lachnospiraceae bacterium]|nr:hypothetical protein [Lachnospiraceae bacterium]
MGWFLTISLIILFFLMRDNRQVSMEGEYLKLQQSLIDSNYRILKQTRIQDYERMIRELDEQMKKLKISNSAEKSVKIQNYLTHLEQEYASLRSGIYCDDPMIDAVLCYQAGILERSGVAFSCHCQDYARGRIEESDLAQILLRMLETAAQTCPELNEQNAQNSDNPPCSAMTLGISSLKGQLILHMSLTTGNTRPLKTQWMKPWLKKYSGALRQECQNGCRDVVVGLAMGEEE